MTFPQLQYLLEIHRTGSISLAAKNLFVSQSSVSVALSTLEKELGFPVFTRTRKGMIPTERGAKVIEHAAQICKSHRLMTEPLQQEFRQVRISSVTMPPVQDAFLRLVEENRDCRDVYFSLTYERNANQKLQVFNLDLAFSIVLTPHLLTREANTRKQGLETAVLCTIPGALRIGKSHRLFHAETISPADLENDLFLDTAGSGVSNALLDTGILHVRHSIGASQHAVREKLIRDGLAYEITYWLGKDPECGREYRYIPLEGASYKLLMTENPQRPRTPEVSRFLELLHEEIKTIGLK